MLSALRTAIVYPNTENIERDAVEYKIHFTFNEADGLVNKDEVLKQIDSFYHTEPNVNKEIRDIVLTYLSKRNYVEFLSHKFDGLRIHSHGNELVHFIRNKESELAEERLSSIWKITRG
jgi:hypothetical protein